MLCGSGTGAGVVDEPLPVWLPLPMFDTDFS